MTDPYVYPGTDVLRNTLGLLDREAVLEAEHAISAVVSYALTIESIPGRYDLRHLCGFHKRIFGRIYPWAGELRTVAIAKTDLFCLPQHIRPYADSVFTDLNAEKHLRGTPREEFVDRLTHFYAEVNAVHPFREGNGRTQRAFFGQLSRDAGWPLHWGALDRAENLAASVASLRGDNGPLRDMLNRLVAPEP